MQDKSAIVKNMTEGKVDYALNLGPIHVDQIIANAKRALDAVDATYEATKAECEQARVAFLKAQEEYNTIREIVEEIEADRQRNLSIVDAMLKYKAAAGYKVLKVVDNEKPAVGRQKSAKRINWLVEVHDLIISNDAAMPVRLAVDAAMRLPHVKEAVVLFKSASKGTASLAGTVSDNIIRHCALNGKRQDGKTQWLAIYNDKVCPAEWLDRDGRPYPQHIRKFMG